MKSSSPDITCGASAPANRDLEQMDMDTVELPAEHLSGGRITEPG